MISEKENLENMKHCPRFETCSISLCPLDYFMKERYELPEDKKCILRKSLGSSRSNRMEGRFSTTMRGLASSIPNINKN